MFRIDKVSFQGIGGAVMVAVCLALLLDGVPSLRGFFLWAALAGAVFGVGLVLYRRAGS